MNKEELLLKNSRDLLNKMASLNNFKMKDKLKGYKSSEVHCIEYIDENLDSNVTKLAQAFYVTRGAISKLTQKLIKKGLIEKYQKIDNKKEIYFKLTEQGKAISKLHNELHQEFQKRDKAVFDKVTEKQFDIMLKFIEDYSKHLDKEIRLLGVDITTGNDFET